MGAAFPVSGLKELDAFLSAFPMKMQKAAYRAGLVAAAAPVRDEARVLARKRSGKMAKAIKSGSARQNPDGTFSISIRLDGEHSFLGIFEEYGVSAHMISPGDAKLMATVRKARANGGRADVLDDIESRANKTVFKIGDDFVSGTISHPGYAAHPFMRPALDTKAEAAVKAFAGRIRDYIEGKTGFAVPLEDAA